MGLTGRPLPLIWLRFLKKKIVVAALIRYMWQLATLLRKLLAYFIGLSSTLAVKKFVYFMFISLVSSFRLSAMKKQGPSLSVIQAFYGNEKLSVNLSYWN